MKFAKGDIVIHRASGEKCVVSDSGQWEDGKSFYVFSLGVDSSQVKKMQVERAEVVFELLTLHVEYEPAPRAG